MGQLVLGQLIEEVRLVLPSIRAPQQLPAAGGRIEADSGVMAGGHGVRALVQRPVQQGTELDLPVAVNAGIGCAAVGVGPHKPVHDPLAEQIAQVQHHMGNPHAGGHGAGCLDIIRRAAQARAVLIGMQAQRHAGDIIAGLPQQQRRRGAVHAAAHGHKYTLGHKWVPPEKADGAPVV